MVLHKEGKMLYDGVNTLVAENLDRLAKEKVIPVFPTGGVDDPMHQIQEGEFLLKGLKGIWDDHSANMVRLGQILKYMVCSNYCFVSHLTEAQRTEYTPRPTMYQKYGMLDFSFFLSILSALPYKSTSSKPS
jgi:hypothetical protein